jgi:hypothetical protein
VEPDGGAEVVEGLSILHAAGTGHREQTRDRDFALGASASKTGLAPLNSAAECPLSGVVGGLDALVAEKGKEPFKVFQQCKSEVGHIPVAAIQIAVRQSEELLFQRNGFFD